MDALRIGIDTNAAQGRKTGIGSYVSSLLQALRALDIGHTFVELAGTADRELTTPERLMWQQVRMPRMARRHQVDVLHATGFDPPVWQPMPLVTTVLDLIGMLHPENLPPISRFYWSRWLPFAVRRAPAIVAISEDTKQSLIRLLGVPEERITVTPLAADPRFHPVVEEERRSAARQRYVLPDHFMLYVGTLEPRKGIDRAIRAAKALEEAGTYRGALAIAGKRGWYADDLFKLATELRAPVQFLDYVSDEDLPVLYSLADAFVYPSQYEGFGLPPLEAMACGTPVVCSDAGALPEVVGDAAIAVPPMDVGALVQALGALLQSPERQAMLRARGLERAATFSWEKTARAMLAVYERVAEAARGRGPGSSR